jgi:hypothetical protein
MKSITTLCRDCIFAEYQNDYDGTPVQEGCKLDRISKFKENNITILEGSDDPENPPADGYKEFYAIENTICNTLRTEKWREKHLDKNFDELIDLVNQEIKINYNWIIVNRTETEEEIRARLSEVGKQSIKPARISFIRYQSSPTQPKTIGTLINREKSLRIPWSIEDVVEDKTTEDETIDLILSKNKTQFYFISSANEPILTDISIKVNDIVNSELKRFGLLEIGKVKVGASSVHINMQGGMFGTTFKEKLEALCPTGILVL